MSELGAPLPLKAIRVSDSDIRLEPGSPHRDWMSETPYGFARRCLPLLVANQQGWMLLNDDTFHAVWDGSERVEGLSLWTDDHELPATARSHFGCGVITWTLPYLFRTPPGFDILLRGPANWPKDGVSPLEGIVETDWSPATATMNWKLTRPNLSVTFRRDEPIAMLVPIRRGQSEEFDPRIESLEAHPELSSAYSKWGEDRERFLKQTPELKSVRDQWQGDYFIGQIGTTRPRSHPHRRRYRLRPFLSDTESASSEEAGY